MTEENTENWQENVAKWKEDTKKNSGNRWKTKENNEHWQENVAKWKENTPKKKGKQMTEENTENWQENVAKWNEHQKQTRKIQNYPRALSDCYPPKNRGFSDTICHTRGWTLDFGQQISHCVPKFPHPDTGPRIFFGLTRILSRVSVTGEALAIRILGFDNNINRDTWEKGILCWQTLDKLLDLQVRL